MPKNQKKRKNTKNVVSTVKEFNVRSEEQEYARIIRPLGNHRMLCSLVNDGSEKLGIIRKTLRGKKNYIYPDDVVLVSVRDFQDGKVDIINVYNESEVQRLIRMKELPSTSIVDNFFIEEEDVELVIDMNDI